MCIIISVGHNADPPDLETLELAEKGNSDGGGIAWPTEKNGVPKVYYRKGIDLKEMLTIMPKKGPFVIHFRTATKGGDSKGLTHPFPISQTVPIGLSGFADAVLFHNGTEQKAVELVMHHAERPFMKGPISDSRAMAYLAWKFGVHYIDLFNSKICVLTPGGPEYYGLNVWYQDKDKNKDVWFSNDYFRSKAQKRSYGTYPYCSEEEYQNAWKSYGCGSKGNDKEEKKENNTQTNSGGNTSKDSQTNSLSLLDYHKVNDDDTKDVVIEINEVEELLPIAIKQLISDDRTFPYYPVKRKILMIEEAIGIELDGPSKGKAVKLLKQLTGAYRGEDFGS